MAEGPRLNGEDGANVLHQERQHSPCRCEKADGDATSHDMAIQRERTRIAVSIHDGVAQNLALLLLKLEIISRLADTDIDRMKDELRKSTRILEASIDQLRQAVFPLPPSDPNGASRSEPSGVQGAER